MDLGLLKCFLNITNHKFLIITRRNFTVFCNVHLARGKYDAKEDYSVSTYLST